MRIFDHFGWIAPHYDRLASAPDAAFFHKTLQLPTPGRLLDAGGGTGRISHPLSGAVGQVVLLDSAWKMAAQARQKPGIFPLAAEVEGLPFASESFSRVMMIDALHHVRNAGFCLKELLRVLEPDGRLIILEPDIHLASGKVVAVLEKLLLMRSHIFSDQEILAFFRGANVSTQVSHFRGQVLITVDRM